MYFVISQKLPQIVLRFTVASQSPFGRISAVGLCFNQRVSINVFQSACDACSQSLHTGSFAISGISLMYIITHLK